MVLITRTEGRRSSAERASCTGSFAHRRPISSSSSASERPPRSRLSRSSRSRTASITASVFVRPVSGASSAAKRSVSAFPMSSAMALHV